MPDNRAILAHNFYRIFPVFFPMIRFSRGARFQHVALLNGLLLLSAWPVQAFKIDPWSYGAPTLSAKGVERQLEGFVNNPRQVLLGPVSWASQVPAAMAQLKEPVHENMTELSIRCAIAPLSVENGLISQCAGRSQLMRNAPGFSESDLELVRASRWPDAPPMRPGSFINPSRLVCGEVRVPENAACWALLMSANSTEGTEPDTPVVEGAEARTRRALGNLLRRSHFGDMQFLHAMASPGEAPARTRERMLLWAAFTFGVANGTIATDAPIASLAVPLQAEVLRGLSDRTVHQFFETRAAVSPETIRRTALGALLHMVQDSFSASHVQRGNETVGDAATPFGAIMLFHDYGCQSPDKHAEADRAESAPWLAARLRPARAPAKLGAQLIANRGKAGYGLMWRTPFSRLCQSF
jgi:hypothetical protein